MLELSEKVKEHFRNPQSSTPTRHGSGLPGSDSWIPGKGREDGIELKSQRFDSKNIRIL
jgi:hypothetical protein